MVEAERALGPAGRATLGVTSFTRLPWPKPIGGERSSPGIVEEFYIDLARIVAGDVGKDDILPLSGGVTRRGVLDPADL